MQDSKTHPCRTKRLFAIENGWSKAKDKNARGITNEHTTENSSTPNSITNHSVEKTENSETDKLHSIKTESESNYLRYKVTLHDQPNEIYFLTSQNNLVRFHNNSFFIVGKISKYGKSGFPYIITGNATKYFVSPKGNIVDSDGNAVGYMKIYKS